MKKIIIVLVLFFVISFIYNHFFFKSMVVGTYVNRNNQDDFTGYIPNTPDTLKLFEDNSYNSYTNGYHNNGKYKLSYSFGGTEISINPHDRSSMPFQTTINRLYSFGNIKIDLFEDLDQYYEKID